MEKPKQVSSIWVFLPLFLGGLGLLLAYWLANVFPIFLGFIGGIIVYWLTADNNKGKANAFLLLGAFTSVMVAFLIVLLR